MPDNRMSAQIPSTVDTVIIGGGHNGLVCSFYLARAGQSVVVLEQNESVGGGCVTEELFPGAHFSTCANILWQLQPKVEEDMQLHDHGLRYDPLQNRVALFENRERLVYSADAEQTAAEVGRLNANDGRRVKDWNEFWFRAASLLHPYFLRDAPTMDELRLQARRAGDEEILDALLTKTTKELCDEYFEDERVKATLTHGEDVGFFTRGSAFIEAWWQQTDLFTNPGASHGTYVRGGMGSVTQAMQSAAEAAGVQVFTGVEVSRIARNADGRAAGVLLSDGQRIDSGAVISNADPKRTFGALLEEDTAGTADEWTTKISYQKFHGLVRELPDLREYFDGEQPAEKDMALLRIAPSLDAGREAREAAEAGELPEVPVVGGLFIPSTFDASLAPEGLHTVSAWIMYAPGKLAKGNWDQARAQAGKRFIDRVTEFVPNFAASLVDWTFLLPVDIENRNHMTDGNIRHLDCVPGQFWDRRPRLGWGHRTPIDGLYLCGAGTHPGGEVTGANGFNAARCLLADVSLVENDRMLSAATVTAAGV